jgi:hypothetical protein
LKELLRSEEKEGKNKAEEVEKMVDGRTREDLEADETV